MSNIPYKKEFIFECIEQVNSGEVSNYIFSNANFVILSREYFDALLEKQVQQEPLNE